MEKFILGKKIGMTQHLNEEGVVIPVTVVKVDPCVVLEIRTEEKNGYNAIVLGTGECKETKLNKPDKSQYKAAKSKKVKHIKEFRVDDVSAYEVGSEVNFDIFEAGEKINVRSTSIGKGFAGTVKRHNFSRGLMSHGSKSHRLPGSIGGGTTPGRVLKGTKMGGHMGNAKVTVRNSVVIKSDSLFFVKGAVPGKKNNLVEIFS